MRSAFCVATTLLAAASVYAQNSFSINTPSNAVVCQPLLITWQGGTSPYYLSVLPGNTPTGTALEDLGTFNGTSFTWKVNIAAGTQIGLTLRDTNGALAQSAAFTINPGGDTSCVGQAVTGTAGTATATGVPTGATTATTAVTHTTTANTGATTANTGTASTPSASKSNAARPENVAKIGTAGIIGAALAALLA